MQKRGLIFFMIAGALLGVAFFVSASSKDDIVFPVAELGNCADETQCREYCGDFSHAEECFAFAKKHNLTKGQQMRDRAVRQLEKGGPGDCASEEECRTYCGDPAHGEECLKFAEENGFMTKDELARARKFLRLQGPGGCRGEECRTYCEVPEHQEECFEFAKKNGLIGEKEARLAEKVLKGGGPGGCKGERECRTYCEDPAHIEECVAFAEKYELISKEDAARAKKIAGKTGPGGCRGEECREFCENPDHMEQCIKFAEENGLMPPEEIIRAKKMIGKQGPGGCRAKACETYCEDSAHAQECIQFAVENELLPPEEVARAKKFMQIGSQGGPGGCQGRACEMYCGDPAHREECFEFAKKNGLVSDDELRGFEAGRKLELVVAEKGGPGGCKSENECRAYCQDPAHVEECIAFASAHGGIAVEQARMMLEQFARNAGGHRFGPQGEQGFKSGGFPGRPEEFPGGGATGSEFPGEFGGFDPRAMEERMKKFEEFMRLERQFRGEGAGFQSPTGSGVTSPGGFQGGGFSGPGGCTSPDACIKYCFEHQEECAGFGGPGKPGIRQPEDGIPSGHEGGGIIVPPRPGEYRSPREFLQPKPQYPPQPGGGAFPGSAGGFRPEDANIRGPGGCVGMECARYCSDPAHGIECAKFFAPSSVQPVMPPPSSGGSGALYPAGGGAAPYPYPVGAPYPASAGTLPPQEGMPAGGTFEGDVPSPEQLLAPEPVLQDYDENGEPRGALSGNVFGIILEPFARIFR